MTIVLQFFPNGEFSQGVDTSGCRPPKNVCKQTQTSLTGRTYTIADIERVKRQNADIPSSVYSKLGSRFKGNSQQTYVLMEKNDTSTVLSREGDKSDFKLLVIPISIYRLVHLGLLSPLVHQSLESCEKPQSRKKLLSMSKRMSRNIRNAVYFLEQQKGGKDVLSFLTLTLPDLSAEGLESCCQNWDSMVKRFMDWLRFKMRQKGMALEHVYCTEIQMKRLSVRGEYAPHLHIVFRGRNARKSPWVITPKAARNEWSRCIHAYVSEEFDTSALENLQRIKYSAARYLSKYLSKGGCSDDGKSKASSASGLRTQWGGMARSLSKRIRQATQRYVGSGESGWIAIRILAEIDSLLKIGYVRYFKRGFIVIDKHDASGLERGLHVGSGCLQTPTYEGGLVPIISYISALSQESY